MGAGEARRKRTRSAAAAVSTIAAAGSGVLAGGPAGAAPIDDGPPLTAEAVEAMAAMDCQNPTDGYVRYRVNMASVFDGSDIGDIELWYSPTCRKVRTVAFVQNNQPACRNDGGFCVRAFATQVGYGTTGYGVSAVGSRKAVTKWVNDNSVQVIGWGAYQGPAPDLVTIGYGETPPW